MKNYAPHCDIHPSPYLRWLISVADTDIDLRCLDIALLINMGEGKHGVGGRVGLVCYSDVKRCYEQRYMIYAHTDLITTQGLQLKIVLAKSLSYNCHTAGSLNVNQLLFISILLLHMSMTHLMVYVLFFSKYITLFPQLSRELSSVS